MADAPVPYESPKYFPFYHRDFMDGVRSVSAACRGGYISLLCYQWDKKSIPGDDLAALALIMGTETRAEAKRVWSKIEGKFIKGVDGAWRNQRLEDVRGEVEAFFARQQENGRKGGRPPGPKGGGKPVGQPTAKPTGSPTAKPGQSHTNTNSDSKSASGSTTHPNSEVDPKAGSSDLSQDLPPETSAPSGAASDAGVNGWGIWTALHAWVTSRPGCHPNTASYFDKVYAAKIERGRLELVVEDHGVAEWFMQHYIELLGEALDATQPARIPVRMLVKRKSVARAS